MGQKDSKKWTAAVALQPMFLLPPRLLETAAFQHAMRIVDSAARWRGDNALKIIRSAFEPDLWALRARMDKLRETTVRRYQQTSDTLSETTQRTILHTAMQLFRDTMKHADLLEKRVSIDSLTGIPNRRALDKTQHQEWSRCLRSGLPLSFCMIDIDFFKPFNDHYGHGPGDECLERIAQTLQGCVQRPGDFVARYGGEEFAAILPATDQTGALQFAQRLHAALAEFKYPHAYSAVAQYITISIGVATTIPTAGLTPDMLSKAADEMLYAAKRAGRNTSQSMVLRVEG